MTFQSAIRRGRDVFDPWWARFVRRLPRTTAGRIQLGMLAVVTLVLLVLVIVYAISRMTPSYWKHNEKLLASDNATLLQLANTFEQRALRDLSGSQEELATTRTVHVAFEEINAWLSIKLEDYLANRKQHLPKEIRHLMLAGEEGKLILAFEFNTPKLQQIISIEVKPIFEASGNRFRLQLMGARAGILPLPVETLRERARGQSPAAREKIDKVFDLLGNQWLEAVQHHPGDARQNLRLTGVVVSEKGLDLTLRSEPRQPVQPAPPAAP